MEVPLFIIALVVALAIWQYVAISVFWHRFTNRLRAGEPLTATVVLRSFGDDPSALARALAQHTRLDFGEIDELIETGATGPLPLRLSPRRAQMLAAEVRALGGELEILRETKRP